MKNSLKALIAVLLFVFAFPVYSQDNLLNKCPDIYLGKFQNDVYYLVGGSPERMGENIHFELKRVLYKPKKPFFSDNVLIYEKNYYAMRCKEKISTLYKTEKYGDNNLLFNYKYQKTKYRPVMQNTPEYKAFEILCTQNNLQ